MQRTDEELTANIGIQQFAVGAVKLIMQATGETTIENMNRDASLSFTSKTKAMIKSLTGSESTDENSGDNENANQNENGGGTNSGENGGQNQGGSTGGNTGGGSDDGGGQN